MRHRTTGLFVDSKNQSWVTVRDVLSRIQGGHTYVVDIAKLHDNEQMLVFGDVVRTIYGVFSGAGEMGMDLGDFDDEDYEPPKRVIIFVDELNKYAPSGARPSPLTERVIDIAERGRSLGVSLISCQQFMSQAHERVTGNCATKVVGRTASSEVADKSYNFLGKDIKSNVGRLISGELIMSHPVYRQPVKIIFPRPTYKVQEF